MPDTPTTRYWDSDVFLSYVNEYPDRITTVETLLENSARGDITIYTSTITQVEVAFAASEQKRQALDPKVVQKIDSLWSDPNVVISVEYHGRIGQTARDLMRHAVTRGWSLKPLDAIHLATAQWLSGLGIEIDEFHTYDTHASSSTCLSSISTSASRTLCNLE